MLIKLVVTLFSFSFCTLVGAEISMCTSPSTTHEFLLIMSNNELLQVRFRTLPNLRYRAFVPKKMDAQDFPQKLNYKFLGTNYEMQVDERILFDGKGLATFINEEFDCEKF